MAKWSDFIKKSEINDPGGWAMNTPTYNVVKKPEGGVSYQVPAIGTFPSVNESGIEKAWNDWARKNRDEIAKKRREDVAKSIELGGRIPAEDSMFHGSPEGNYLRGRFLRGVGKGMLDAPGQLPGVFVGLGTGIAALTTGDGFREGWDFGVRKWDDFAGNKWHGAMKWLSSPFSKRYDKEQSGFLDEVRKTKGDAAADKLISDSQRYDVFGNMTGGLLGIGGIHKAIEGVKALGSAGNVAKATGIVGRGADAAGKGLVGTAYAYPLVQQGKDVYDDRGSAEMLSQKEWQGLSPEELDMIFSEAEKNMQP